jgi:3'-phosphoadenosine 5'-phosphosulfate (PAPS) 3'-phosphatase
MAWEPIVAVIIFIGGLAWGRYDGDRRERRASRAAATAAFEQLQRDTHLELQDALSETLRLASYSHQVREERRAFHAAYGRANVLRTRVADADARKYAHAALEACDTLAEAPIDGYEEARDLAAGTLIVAQAALSKLVRTPPNA